MKVNKIDKADKEFVKEQRNGVRTFLKLCKYDVLPSVVAGSALSTVLVPAYSSDGVLDAALFGGVAGVTFILAVNGVITGVKNAKATRNSENKQTDNNVNEGKTK